MKRWIDEARPARAEAAAEGGTETEADPRVAAFLRGVTIGALVGAAIAGSALWERASRRRAANDAAEVADVSGTPVAGNQPPPS